MAQRTVRPLQKTLRATMLKWCLGTKTFDTGPIKRIKFGHFLAGGIMTYLFGAGMAKTLRVVDY